MKFVVGVSGGFLVGFYVGLPNKTHFGYVR